MGSLRSVRCIPWPSMMQGVGGGRPRRILDQAEKNPSNGSDGVDPAPEVSSPWRIPDKPFFEDSYLLIWNFGDFPACHVLVFGVVFGWFRHFIFSCYDLESWSSSQDHPRKSGSSLGWSIGYLISFIFRMGDPVFGTFIICWFNPCFLGMTFKWSMGIGWPGSYRSGASRLVDFFGKFPNPQKFGLNRTIQVDEIKK